MPKRFINELEALRIVKAERRPNLGGRSDYTVQDFRRALGVSESSREYLSDSLLSNLLNDKPVADENRLLRLIAGPGHQQAATRKRVEHELGLEGLFSCGSRAEVLELIAKVDGVNSGPPRIIFFDAAPDGDFGLTEPETATVGYLAGKLNFSDQPVFHWSAPFNSGASTIVLNLWAALKEFGTCSLVVILRPSDLAQPFEAEIASLSNFLEKRGHRLGSRRQLADAIVSERVLVAVLSPNALDASLENNAMRGLTNEFLERQDQWTGISNILFVGESEWLSKLPIRDTAVQSGRLKTRLRLSGEDRFSEFRAQWDRFARLREQMLSEESGSRMRRAATYFRVQNTTDVWPISVKLRALFASNGRTAAYFDPTQGFKRLAGPRFEEFEDLKSYHEDVSDYVAYVRHLDRAANGSRGKKKHYYLLQYVSTAKHWLTEEALETLIDKVPGERQNPLNLVTEKGRMLGLQPIITETREEVSGTRKSKYFAGIAVKAAVQDDWIALDPFTRSLAHYRIAKRLKDNENDKELLDREFPYEPHWGRSRIFFLAETIRHLVRSCETFSGRPGAYDRRSFAYPDAPSRTDGGTDPIRVINYCYEVLYQNGLNGNANGVSGRALAKRYGAYQLAVELLELMSDDYDVGRPHPALLPAKRIEFMRECGYALLDIGELHRARTCFENAERELDGPGREIDQLNIMLDLTLVDSALGNLQMADGALKQARLGIEQLHQSLVADGVAWDSFRQVRKLFRRLLSREAHLAFLRGEHAAALDLIDQIQNEKRWEHAKARGSYDRNILVPSFTQRLEPEQTHLLIAALHRATPADNVEAETSDFAIALDRCLEAMLYAQSEGNHHQAMGFRIALARCFRRMKRFSAAETILDAVHHDLLRYGCSERTFLAFLNEAGRVLVGRGDPIRAYATYLRPAIGRAKARGFRREAEQAATLSLHALEQIQDLIADCQVNAEVGQEAWRGKLNEAICRHRKLISDAEDIFRGGPFEKDPLFAYAIADAEKVIEELQTSDDIAKHTGDVGETLRALRAIPQVPAERHKIPHAR